MRKSFFLVSRNFFINFDFKNGWRNEFKDINENHEADPDIKFLRKSISKSYGRGTAMPPALVLRFS